MPTPKADRIDAKPIDLEAIQAMDFEDLVVYCKCCDQPLKQGVSDGGWVYMVSGSYDLWTPRGCRQQWPEREIKAMKQAEIAKLFYVTPIKTSLPDLVVLKPKPSGNGYVSLCSEPASDRDYVEYFRKGAASRLQKKYP